MSIAIMPHASTFRGRGTRNNFLDEFSVIRMFLPVDPPNEDFYRHGMTRLNPPNVPLTDAEVIDKLYAQVPKLT